MEIENLEIAPASSAIGVGTKPNLLFRWFAVLVALASTAALSLVAVLSIGCYAAAVLLGKIPPLRNAYRFLSRTYDHLLARVGQKVLRDPRDTPALRLMVSLTFTAVPIFLAQLVLGRPRLLSFTVRSQVRALRANVQRQTPGSAPAPGLFLGEVRQGLRPLH